MICVFCGNEIDDTSTVCPCCNQTVTPVQPEPEQNYYQPVQENTYYQIPEQQDNAKQGEYTGYAQQPQNDNYNPYGAQGYYQQPQQNGNYYQQQNNFYQPQVDVAKTVDTSRILGILSIVIGILVSGLAGAILGAIGLSKVNQIAPMYPNVPDVIKAKKLNSWGIGLSVGLRVAIFILWFVFVLIFGFATAGSALGGLDSLY